MSELAHRRPQTVATQVDWDAALRYLNLSPKDPRAQALVMVCNRYDLDPMLGHVSLYDGKPYVHFAGYLHIANSHPAYLGPETVREWEDDTYYHATVRVHRSDRSFPSERTGKSRKVKRKKDGTTYTDEDADAKAFAQACRRVLRMAFNVAHPDPGEEDGDPVPAPTPVVEVVRMTQVDGGVPTEEAIGLLGSSEAAKELVSRPIVSDRYREAVKIAQLDIFGQVWEDFWRLADLKSWREVLLAARERMNESSRQPSDPGKAATPPGGPAGSGATSEAAAMPATSGSHTRDPASDTDASATGHGDTDVPAGHEPPNAEAPTSPASPGDGKAGREPRGGRAQPGKAAPADPPPAAPAQAEEAEQAAFEQGLDGDDTGKWAR